MSRSKSACLQRRQAGEKKHAKLPRAERHHREAERRLGAAKRLRREAERQRAAAERRRQREADQRREKRLGAGRLAVAGADVFVGLTSGGIGATGAGIGDLFHSAAASPVSQLYSHVFRDSGDNPNPDLPEPVRTTYTGWYGGGTAVASVPSRLVPGGIIPLDSWGWAYVPNVLGD